MKSLHKKLGVLAVAGAMAAGVAGNAQAGVLAQSVLEISNFQFLNSPEGSPVSASQFDTLDFQDSSLITANLNGVIASHLEQSTTLGTLNNPQQCVGNCAFVENDYTHHYLPTVNVARGDSLLRGAPITTTGAAGTFPADAHVLAEGQLTTIGGFGSVAANLGLSATFHFSTKTDQTITIFLNSDSHLISEVQAGNKGTARASETWVIRLVDHLGKEVFSWSPDGQLSPTTGAPGGVEIVDTCNLQKNTGAQQPGQTDLYDCPTGIHEATTGLLLASETYTLTLTHSNNVDATRRVPEPGTLLLLGLGLAGLGFGAWRGKRVA